ncbi:MAG: efflux RND transporter periplasmic adaptor subunit [Bacteroidales bacterium]|nr:efflux RND transporter periplasmic adaptor subunit [Bacteroidales bacterium]
MKKFFRNLLIVLVGAIVLGVLYFLWKKSQPEVAVYELVSPKIGNIEKKTVATGKVEPRDEIMIKPQISGIIEMLYKEAGQMVKAGEILAKVKVIPEMGQLTSAESRLNVSQISLDQSKSEYDRQFALFQKGVISKDDFEKVDSNYKKAKEELANAKESLQIIRDGISQRSAKYSTTQIKATISGMILDIPVKVGSSVIQSNNFNEGTTIASIANMGDMIFKGKIDETEVGRVTEKMPITLTIGALQDKKFSAILEYVSPKGVEENGAILFEIKAAAKIPDSVFVRAGYSANAEIILGKKEKVIIIPENTVEFSHDSAFVNVLKEEKPVQTYTKKFVKVGMSDGISIEVVSGIKLKDKLRGNKVEKVKEIKK